jgi:hypothetical protein
MRRGEMPALLFGDIDWKRRLRTAQDVCERHSTTMPSSSLTDQADTMVLDAPPSSLRPAVG